MSNHFKIIVPFYNVEEWIATCIRSVKVQKYRNFECILVDDLSTDQSVEVVRREIQGDDRFKLIVNNDKAFALKNIYDAINVSEADDEDIIVTLDGDDWLASAEVLTTLCDIYEKEGCWITYGSYAEYPSGVRGKFARQIPQEILDNNKYRDSAWCSSHLRTFKKHLWSKIDPQDLRDTEGEFFRMAWDLSFMFPMLEMASHRSKYIKDILYVYNVQNPLNDHKVDHKLQLATERYIRSKPKYGIIEDSS